MIYKYILIIFLILCILLKSFRLIGLLFLFTPLYYYIFTIFYKIYKNYDNYCRITIDNISEVSSSFTLWMAIHKIDAFNFVYKVFEKKKIKPISVLIFSIVYLFSIPVRFIKLLYHICTTPGTLNDTLLHIWCSRYFRYKDHKIEVLNRFVYLNPNLWELVRNAVD
jgi:hypothetical protein